MHNLIKYLNQMVKQHHSTLYALLKAFFFHFLHFAFRDSGSKVFRQFWREVFGRLRNDLVFRSTLYSLYKRVFNLTCMWEIIEFAQLQSCGRKRKANHKLREKLT